jgi:hypothetical protein
MPTILQTLLVNSFHGSPLIEIIVSPLLSPPNDLKPMFKLNALHSSNGSYPLFFEARQMVRRTMLIPMPLLI